MSAEEFSERDALAALREQIVEVNGEPRVKVDVDGRRHTVELRPIYEFENDILNRLIEPRTDNSVTGGAIPIKGEWIYGWLEVQGEDYINNIWRNYQYFLKYIEARTSVINNISTHQRSPGTYKSMYRYIIILEELGLLERFRRVDVPQSEYDFPVPEEFRTRTFIRLTSDFEEEKDKWDNPYEALYPGGEKPEDIDVEPVRDIPEELSELAPDEETEEEEAAETTPPEETKEGLDAFTDEPEEESEEPSEEPQQIEGELELPEENASFADFPQKEGLVTLVENSFSTAMQITMDQAPIPVEGVEAQDFDVGRIAVFGKWAVGEAVPGRTELDLIVTVDDTSADISPGFVPAGIQEHLGDVMRENNPYPEIFPDYSVVSAYNSAFKRLLSEVVRKEQTQLVYYDLQDMEFKELE